MEDSNLVKARSSIVWILAIVVSFGAVWWIERESGRELIARPGNIAPARATDLLATSPDLPATPAARPLTAQERQWALVAWAYFERNTDPRTGLVAAVEGFPSATLWDTASLLLALISARDLGLVDQVGFDTRVARALDALARLPLYADALPNKTYDIRSLAMTDYANRPVPTGIGWSAIDLGRLLVPLNVIAWHHPQHTAAARRVIGRWDTTQLARDGQLWGMHVVDNGAPQLLQEGRLGYEQYAARTLALLGLDLDVASDWQAHLKLVDVDGIRVPADRRDPQQFGAQNYVLSEPYLLTGLEFGFADRQAREAAWRVYRAQEERARKTGTLTAVTEDHIDQAPYFLYGTVYSGGKAWATVSEKGEDLPALRSLSVKAAFGWHALYRTPYTSRLVNAVADLHDPIRGWYAGRYEQGGMPNQALTANTNAVVLESLAFIARGPSLRWR